MNKVLVRVRGKRFFATVLSFCYFLTNAPFAKSENFPLQVGPLKIWATSSGSTSVVVLFAPTTLLVESLLLNSPPRIVVDLHGLPVPRGLNHSFTNNLLIAGLRVGRHPQSTRIVLDLHPDETGDHSFVVESEKTAEAGTLVRIVVGKDPKGLVSRKLSEEVIGQESLPPDEFVSALPFQESHSSKESAAPPASTEDLPIQAESVSESKPQPKELISVRSESNLSDQTEEPAEILASAGENQPAIDFASEQPVLVERRASFSIDKLHLYLPKQGRPVDNLILTSVAPSEITITSRIEQRGNPAKTSPSGSPAEKIIVSPKKFVLQPGEKRTVRLVLRSQPAKSEELYSVIFTGQQRVPELSAITREINLEPEQIKSAVVESAVITVALAVDPVVPLPLLKGVRKDDSLSLSNRGNITISVEQAVACRFVSSAGATAEECREFPPMKVAPGGSLEYQVARPESFRFIKSTRQGYESITMPPS